jgi:hypothetical protein
MTAIVTRGDAGNLHLPDATVDLIVTSPPYFGLRSYQDGGEHYAEQIGAEATPAEYLDALMACTAEWMRVLKPGGSIFVNLGDKYSGQVRCRVPRRTDLAADCGGDGFPTAAVATTARYPVGVPSKSLMMLPQRYAIRCIDELGLILRAEIVWAKPNGLPESVTDRVRRSHEQVFHFVKQPRYYSAVDEVREQYDPVRPWQAKYAGRLPARRGRATRSTAGWAGTYCENPLGKLPGSVWTIPTAPLRVPEELGIDHFAAYPPELVRRIVLGWSPREVCTACGEGRRPVVRRRWAPRMSEPGTRTGKRNRRAARGAQNGNASATPGSAPTPHHRLRLRLPRHHRTEHARRRPRSVRRHGHHGARRLRPRPHRDQQRPVRGLLPPWRSGGRRTRSSAPRLPA